jgi:hypothetical protein
MSFLLNSVIGTRDHVERLLLTKGLSEPTVAEIIRKIEIIIGLSGQLGKLVQRDKDMEELRSMQLEIHSLRQTKGVM